VRATRVPSLLPAIMPVTSVVRLGGTDQERVGCLQGRQAVQLRDHFLRSGCSRAMSHLSCLSWIHHAAPLGVFRPVVRTVRARPGIRSRPPSAVVLPRASRVASSPPDRLRAGFPCQTPVSNRRCAAGPAQHPFPSPHPLSSCRASPPTPSPPTGGALVNP